MASTYIGLRAIEAQVRASLRTGVKESGDVLLPKVEDATPVLSGTLRGSERADAPRGAGDTVTVKVHTGPAADEYDEVAYGRHKPGRLYMRNPLLAHAAEHVKIVAAAARRAL